VEFSRILTEKLHRVSPVDYHFFYFVSIISKFTPNKNQFEFFLGFQSPITTHNIHFQDP
jgi:hypothetical protein